MLRKREPPDRQVERAQIRKMTAEAIRAVHLHLKDLRDITPESMRAAARENGPKAHEKAGQKAHAPPKPQQLHLAFPSPWPELQRLSKRRGPHQPPNSPQVATQAASGKRRRNCNGMGSHVPEEEGRSVLGSHECSLNTLQPQAAAALQQRARSWSVHTPLSEEAQQRLEATSALLRATHARRKQLPPLAVALTRIPGRPAAQSYADRTADLVGLEAPAPPKPRKKVWQPRPYSVHAPNFQRVRPKGKLSSSNELRMHIMGKCKPK
jgi:hypothetical protein